MLRKTCTFVGNRTINDGIREEAEQTIRRLIKEDGVREFLCGGMGDFDRICAGIVRAMKRGVPDLRLRLGMSSMSTAVMEMTWAREAYDEIVISDELDQAHFKQAITLRNRWMVDSSDVVLACVQRDYGGAYRTVRYAARTKKPLLFIREKPEITQRLFYRIK